MQAQALILAAGAGTRMKSTKPKVAHEILGVPLVCWVMDAAKAAGIDGLVAVLGHGAEAVRPIVEPDARIVIQKRQLGTGDAVACARPAFERDGAVPAGSLVVLSGDCPLIRPETISSLVSERERTGAAVVVLTMDMPDPTGYGRIVRSPEGGAVLRIVEQKDCSPEEAAITECNAGFYCFDAPALFEALEQVSSDNAQGEYYLTDVLEICRRAGREVLALKTRDASEALGVNSRVQLAQALRVMRERVNERHMAAGVTMWDPDSTFIGPYVEIEPDVELLPNVMLLGKGFVGGGSVVGPNTRLTDTRVGRGCTVDETVAVSARIDDGATTGPRAYLRPEAHLCEGAKVGTHVEVKKSVIGAGSKVPHLSYIGDATLGEGVNVGAGTITCNYDGVSKHHTNVGNGVFIGSDTMLVAPVSIGDGAVIGASSCIVKDVSPDALALERAEQREIPGWAARHMEKLKSLAEQRRAQAGR